MRRGRTFFILAFIILLALLAFVVVWRFVGIPGLSPTDQVVQPTPIPVRIVYIVQPVGKGEQLTNDNLGTMMWEEDAVVDGMFLEQEMVGLYGRQAKYDLDTGIPVVENLLLDPAEQLPSEGSPWSLSIPPGMLAVSIPIDRLSSVSYAPRPGDHVNVIATLLFVDLDTDFQSSTPNNTGIVIASGPVDPETLERDPLSVGISSPKPQTGDADQPGGFGATPPGFTSVYGRTELDPVLGQAVFLVPAEGQRPRMTSQMLLQDVVVLQMGNFPLPETEEDQELVAAPDQAQPTPVPGEEQKEEEPLGPDVITLIVRPQDAITLNYLINSGAELTLALRRIDDPQQIAVKPVTLQFLLEQYEIPVPVRQPYGIHPRIDDLSLPILENDSAPPEE